MTLPNAIDYSTKNHSIFCLLIRMQLDIIRSYIPSEQRWWEKKRPAVFQKMSALCRGCSQTFRHPVWAWGFASYTSHRRYVYPQAQICALCNTAYGGKRGNAFSSWDSDTTSVKVEMHHHRLNFFSHGRGQASLEISTPCSLILFQGCTLDTGPFLPKSRNCMGRKAVLRHLVGRNTLKKNSNILGPAQSSLTNWKILHADFIINYDCCLWYFSNCLTLHLILPWGQKFRAWLTPFRCVSQSIISFFSLQAST